MAKALLYSYDNSGVDSPCCGHSLGTWQNYYADCAHRVLSTACLPHLSSGALLSASYAAHPGGSLESGGGAGTDWPDPLLCRCRSYTAVWAADPCSSGSRPAP